MFLFDGFYTVKKRNVKKKIKKEKEIIRITYRTNNFASIIQSIL